MAVTREQRLARRRDGLCVRCGAEAAAGPIGPRSLCDRHLREARERQIQRHREHIEAGLCAVCSEPAEHGRQKCTRHLDEWGEYQQLRREAHNAEGLCVRCGYLVPAVFGHTLCAKHIEADRVEGEREYDDKIARGRELRAEYREERRCPKCGDDPAPGYVQCARHVEIARVDAAKHRQRTKRRELVEVARGVVRREKASTGMDRVEAMRRDADAGMSKAAIGAKYGVSKQRVHQILGARLSTQKRSERDAQIAAAYLAGETSAELAHRWALSVKAVHAALKRSGVKQRPIGGLGPMTISDAPEIVRLRASDRHSWQAALLAALERADGSRVKARKDLGVSAPTLTRWLDELRKSGVDIPRKGSRWTMPQSSEEQ